MNLETLPVTSDGAIFGDITIPLTTYQRAGLKDESITVGVRPRRSQSAGQTRRAFTLL